MMIFYLPTVMLKLSLDKANKAILFSELNISERENFSIYYTYIYLFKLVN